MSLRFKGQALAVGKNTHGIAGFGDVFRIQFAIIGFQDICFCALFMTVLKEFVNLPYPFPCIRGNIVGAQQHINEVGDFIFIQWLNRFGWYRNRSRLL